MDLQFGIWPRAKAAINLQARQFIELNVVDEAGQPIPKFELRAHAPEGGGHNWKKGTQGKWRSDSPVDKFNVIDIIVRADGFASSIKRFSGEDCQQLASGEATIVLKRGQKSVIRFQLPQELRWPEGAVPEVYFSDCMPYIRIMRQPANRAQYKQLNAPEALDANMLNVRAIAPSEFALQVAVDTAPFYVAVHSPGFLQSFEAGPFTARDFKEGAIEIPLPQPAHLTVRFDPGEYAVPRPYSGATLGLSKQYPGQESYSEVEKQNDALTTSSIDCRDLSPGNYWAIAETTARDVTPVPGRADASHFMRICRFTVEAGETKQVDVRYVPYDPNVFRGDHTAILKLETRDGKPAAGREVRIEYCNPYYGEMNVLTKTVPADGQIEVKNIIGARLEDSDLVPFRVHLDGKQVGIFAFSGELKVQEFTIRARPEVGDQVPDIELFDLKSGKTKRLSEFRGKPVVLDLWATWCGPCQTAMSALDRMAERNATTWKNRVILAAVSIDERPETAKSHLINRGWTHLDCYWSGGEQQTGAQSPIMREFAVLGVPETIVVGADGKVVWRGHPTTGGNGQVLEDLIQRLRK